jgi:hypothetical protein
METLFAQTLRVHCGFILLACGLIVCPRLHAGGAPVTNNSAIFVTLPAPANAAFYRWCLP